MELKALWLWVPSTSDAHISQYQGCSDKQVFISVREEGEYTQRRRNMTTPSCTLP